MGCFGYICKGCGTAVRGDYFKGGEKCVMIHVRHGKELGRVEGHYNEYGAVIEQKDLPESEKFRGDEDSCINSHREICASEMNMSDSYDIVSEQRIFEHEKLTDFKDNNVNFYWYIGRLICLEAEANYEHWHKSYLFDLLAKETKEELLKMLAEAKTEKDKMRVNARIYVAFDELRCNYNTQLYQDFLTLPKVKVDAYSGIVAWHSACYHKATPEQQADLTPSSQDPNQSWGKIRKKYI